MASFGRFYESSEVVSYYSPRFSLDDASIVERIANKALKGTLSSVQNLLLWDAGWNDTSSIPPNQTAVSHAKNWIVKLYLEVSCLGRPWMQPNVTAGVYGEVVFEWWYRNHKLTIYIGDEDAEYVQVWGTDIYSEMADGNAESSSTCRSLWLWLIS